MNKFLLTMISTLFLGIIQAETAQGRTTAWQSLRTAYPRMLAKKQAQELATMEIDRVSATALRKVSIVLHGTTVFGSLRDSGRALPPLAQARVMLYEREALLGVLQEQDYEMNKSLRNIIKIGGSGVVVAKDVDRKVQAPLSLDKSTFSNTAYFYAQSIIDTLEEPALLVVGERDKINLIATDRELQKYGMPPRTLLKRVRRRAKSGSQDITHTLQELSQVGNDPYPTALAHALASDAGFDVHIEALTDPLLPDGTEAIADDLGLLPVSTKEAMALPGIETKAMIYELAARIAAINSNSGALRENLMRIIKLNNDDDHVEMTISLESKKISLDKNNVHEVQQLYQQVFVPPSS